MPPRASLVFPDEPQRFPDNRTVPKRDAERLEIQRQIDYLAGFPTNEQRNEAVIKRLARGRHERGLPPFVKLSIGRVPALALPEFLVRRDDLERRDVRKVIEDFDLSSAAVARLGGDIVRLTLPRVEDFPDVTADIRWIPITPNYLLPLGGWTKSGPEHTTCRPALPPAGTARIQVAVVDTGLGARTDEWLHGLTNPEVDELYPDRTGPTFGLASGHGTFVAGIVQRVEPSTDIRMYRALDVDGIGSDIDVGAKIEQAAMDGARIINLSIGTQTVDDRPPAGIEAGIRRAIGINNHILIVCSAGNYGGTRKVWPGAFSQVFRDNVVAVAGLNASGERPYPEWSSHGDWVQVSTIAEGIASTYVEGVEDTVVDNPPDVFALNDWAIWSGTSFAAPQVAGAVASICLTDQVTPTEAINRLQQRGTPIPGYGMAVRILTGT